jgi:hypothetical protein
MSIVWVTHAETTVRCFTDICSGSVERLQRGLAALEDNSEEEGVAELVITQEEYSGPLLALLDRSSMLPTGSLMHLVGCFVHLAYLNEGCEFLLNHNVPSRLLALFDAAEDLTSVETALLLRAALGVAVNIAVEGSGPVSALIDSGVHSRVGVLYDRLVDNFADGPDPHNLLVIGTKFLSHVCDSVPLSQAPEVRACVSSLVRALCTLSPEHHDDARAALMTAFQHVFAAGAAEHHVDWAYIAASGALPCLWALAATPTETAAVLRVLRGLALHASDTGTGPTAVLGDAAMAWLAAVVASPAPLSDALLSAYADALVALTCTGNDSGACNAVFQRHDLLGRQLGEIARRTRGGRCRTAAVSTATAAVSAVVALLSQGTAAAAAAATTALGPALLQAGAPELAAAVLTAPVGNRAGDVRAAQLAACTATRLLLQCGDTRPDDAFIAHHGDYGDGDHGDGDRGDGGCAPANPYLRAFCAAGGGAALALALGVPSTSTSTSSSSDATGADSGCGGRRGDSAPKPGSEHVVALFRDTIGPIVGIDAAIFARAPVEVAAAFAPLAALAVPAEWQPGSGSDQDDDDDDDGDDD